MYHVVCNTLDPRPFNYLKVLRGLKYRGTPYCLNTLSSSGFQTRTLHTASLLETTVFPYTVSSFPFSSSRIGSGVPEASKPGV